MIGRPFDYATDGFEKVVENAHEEALARRQHWVGVEHLWKGIAVERNSNALDAVDVLQTHGVDLEKLDQELDSQLTAEGTGTDSPELEAHREGIRPSPRARSACLRSIQIALELGENCASSGHLLASLLATARPSAVQKLNISIHPSEIANWKTRERGASGRRGEAQLKQTPGSFLIDEYARQLAMDDNDRLASYHYLLALLVDEETVAARILRDHGVDRASVMRAVQALGGSQTSDSKMFLECEAS